MDYKKLNSGGIIKQRQSEFFLIRVKVLAGDINIEQLRVIADLADKYGRGVAHLSVRQGIEIPFVKFENFEELIDELESVGLTLGACGPRVRTIVACPGSSVCRYGLSNTKKLAAKLDQRLYGQEGLPHKFKIGISGCPSSCAKPQENDLGFLGIVEPVFNEADGECTACGICSEICPTGAISNDQEGKPIIDYNLCSFDGRCVSICPVSAIGVKKHGWQVYVGGKFGRKPQLGLMLVDFIKDEEALAIGEKVLQTYKVLGQKGERLREVIERVGFEDFQKEVLSLEKLS